MSSWRTVCQLLVPTVWPTCSASPSKPCSTIGSAIRFPFRSQARVKHRVWPRRALSCSVGAGGRGLTRVGPVNRIAVHQSIVHPFDPVGLVRLAERAGIDSVGLHVATTPEVETWWVKGIGAAMLRDLVAALLAARVTVLDVGRVRLGPELRVWDGQHAYARALELGVRLGAQFVTARADAGVADDPAELFAVLDELAGRYRLRPLLAVVAGTPAATPPAAAAIVEGTRGGIVLVGYVRVPAHELGAATAPGLLATLPPQVPVVIGEPPTAAAEPAHPAGPGISLPSVEPAGSARPGTSTPSGGQAGPHDPTAATAQAEAEILARLTAWRAAVDELLRHPAASER